MSRATSIPQLGPDVFPCDDRDSFVAVQLLYIYLKEKGGPASGDQVVKHSEDRVLDRGLKRLLCLHIERAEHVEHGREEVRLGRFPDGLEQAAEHVSGLELDTAHARGACRLLVHVTRRSESGISPRRVSKQLPYHSVLEGGIRWSFP